MSSSSRRKIHLRQPVVVDVGCNCRRSKLASLFSSSSSPKPKHKPSNFSTATTTSSSVTAYASSNWDPSFASSLDETPSSPTPPPQQQQPQRRTKKSKSKSKERNNGRVERESVAVVKETSEPYSEFKDSMVQMIVEKEIYGWDDLNDLLHRFLSLNSPRHHHLILRAFADLWNGVFSPPSPLAGADDYAPPPYY